MSEEQKKLLEAQLWNIANELRGKMDADEFRDYILGFIFYKYLSEKQHIFANRLLETEAIKDYTLVTDTEDLAAIREESLLHLGYYLKPNELFDAIAKKGNANTEHESDFILEDLKGILNSIEQSTMGTESEDDFNKLFEDLDLNSTKLGRTVEVRNKLISKILSHLAKIDFALEDANSDVLGDAYEYLIAQFASGAGKKAGEFYTPQQVSRILAGIVTTGKKRIRSVYDPTCGSGSLLLRVAREADVEEFYGQELNRTTYNLARMNMILHDVHFSRFDIRQDDTLENPHHLEKRFEAIVANPPFSANWKGKDNPLNETDERFSQYGKLAPGSKADFAFVQHMVYQLADNGTMACVLPHGVLFRGAAEGVIREYLIKKLNYLDAVIGLPANIFYGTSIPTCILVLSKCRVHSDNILFIDASQGYEKVGNQNRLSLDNVNNILTTYRDRVAIDKYSHLATLDEVATNDYNLNIPRYVNTFEEAEKVNIQEVCDTLNELELLSVKNDKLIEKYCIELNIPFPIGHNLSLLHIYKKGVMQMLFSKQIRFKDTNNEDFPEWDEKVLGEVGDIITGKTPDTSNKDLWNGGIQFITPTDIKDGKYQYDVERYVVKNEKMKILPSKSIVFTCIASIGKMALTTKDAITNQQINSIVPTKNYHNEFIYYAVLYISPKIKSTQANTTLPIINKTEFSKFKISIPKDKKEQMKIADFLTAIDNKINAVSAQLDSAKVFKKGLL